MKMPPGRYKRIQELAHAAAFNYRLLLYPADILLYIGRLPNCRAIPYTRLCKDFFAGDCAAFGAFVCSGDGYTDYHAGKKQSILYYNDGLLAPWSAQRMRWTLAHELGHILLGHHVLHDCTRLRAPEMPGELSGLVNREADLFAAEVLAPTPLLLAMEQYESGLNADSIAQHFGLTRSAALNCRKNLDRKKWYLDAYRIAPEADMKYYARFAALSRQLLYEPMPILL